MKIHVALDAPSLTAAPAAPAAGRSLIYVREGGLYTKDSNDKEVPAGAAGAWTAWNPTTFGITSGIGTPTGRYRLLDQKTCAVRIRIPFTGAPSGTGALGCSLPFAPFTTSFAEHMPASLHDISSADIHYVGLAEIRAGATQLFPFWFGWPPSNAATVPSFAFGPGQPPGGSIASGDYLICSGVYELA